MFTVLWDNDGVLVDTEGLYYRACRDSLRSVGLDLTPEQFREVSLRRGQSTLDLAAAQGLGPAEIARLRNERDRAYAASLAEGPRAIDGAEEVLGALYGRVRMGVVTSTTREHFDIAHAGAGLTKYLDFVVSHEDYERSKPHPDAYRTALERYGLRPEACVAVEDSLRGLASARAAGLRCLVVRSEWTRGVEFKGALQVLESIREVPNEVLRLANRGD